MKTRTLALVAAFAGALLVPLATADPLTFEWDTPPPEDQPATFTLEKKSEGETSWSTVATTTNPVISIGTPEPVRTLYRLKVTNAAGVSSYDPNIIADRPIADLNFRIKPPAQAAVDDPGDGLRLAALFMDDGNLLMAPALVHLE
jgi:hypothetical protein